ncbi:hypothetical protein GCK32_020298 [Trichostrongylus colubriformis]|uniref:Uncharacterized protein n=1 Tax=Trichostrongylus colubriformis TaxID=6319 RepID=A0AAN8J048_TRICO
MLGIVVAVTRRGSAINNIYAAFEGAPDFVQLTQSLCSFPLGQVDGEDLLLADARTNVSCAMRFSHAAISSEARRFSTNAIRRFLPAYPHEAILPLRVARVPPHDRAWVDERLGEFQSYRINP